MFRLEYRSSRRLLIRRSRPFLIVGFPSGKILISAGLKPVHPHHAHPDQRGVENVRVEFIGYQLTIVPFGIFEHFENALDEYQHRSHAEHYEATLPPDERLSEQKGQVASVAVVERKQRSPPALNIGFNLGAESPGGKSKDNIAPIDFGSGHSAPRS
jgi:hypothetical protein